MSEAILEIEGESLDEVRARLSSQISDKFYVISERILSDGTPKAQKCTQQTVEAAFLEAQQFIPHNAEILGRRVLATPESTALLVEAFSEDAARSQAYRVHSPALVKKEIKLLAYGHKGFWGIGKKPNQYEVEVLSRQAAVEITYKTKPKVRFELGEKEKAINEAIAKLEHRTFKHTMEFETLTDTLVRLGASEKARCHAASLMIYHANADNEGNTGPDGELYPGARINAALPIAKLGGNSSVDELLRWLNDWAPETREAATLALGTIGATRTVRALLELALRDGYRVHLGDLLGHPGHYIIRCAAVLALRRIGDDEARRALDQIPSETIDATIEYVAKRRLVLEEFGYHEDAV